MHQLIYHRTHITLRDHRYTATVIDSSRQNEQGLTQEIMEMCLKSMPIYYIKLRHTEKINVHFILWQRPWAFERIFFLINAHGVLRRMGAAT